MTIIVEALAAGAGSAAKDVGSSAVKDAYEALRSAVRRLFSGKRAAEDALSGHEIEPAQWRERLAEALREAAAGADPELLDAAREVLRRADPEGSAAGKYTVDAREGKGVQIGDGNVQHNTFS
ncbi:hypothetical protein ORV05_14330 [Amycolatopsis cynarae]|uniref:RHIM domain-containing protein n=1 Tax=Amycolatopsis cynarae TaxID=2995223 RepID=A0ABY7BCB8_9PSEU|nr:hypothetical protein [Amycolatopsis sp. HUAS 11-8]WAL68887.1 hypothetical protein ORV05_14330 [Amycolatopsis sp. HUAS 11-8]